MKTPAFIAFFISLLISLSISTVSANNNAINLWQLRQDSVYGTAPNGSPAIFITAYVDVLKQLGVGTQLILPFPNKQLTLQLTEYEQSGGNITTWQANIIDQTHSGTASLITTSKSTRINLFTDEGSYEIQINNSTGKGLIVSEDDLIQNTQESVHPTLKIWQLSSEPNAKGDYSVKADASIFNRLQFGWRLQITLPNTSKTLVATLTNRELQPGNLTIWQGKFSEANDEEFITIVTNEIETYVTIKCSEGTFEARLSHVTNQGVISLVNDDISTQPIQPVISLWQADLFSYTQNNPVAYLNVNTNALQQLMVGQHISIYIPQLQQTLTASIDSFNQPNRYLKLYRAAIDNTRNGYLIIKVSQQDARVFISLRRGLQYRAQINMMSGQGYLTDFFSTYYGTY
ncbi:hypothetical protein [Zooshikella sp. RANM57]|uniref:hypothetical protein n=1 Tax=Zooshikella sp. RANM57 TaxID=3425863 RepID=UPI003D6FB262